MNIVFVLIGISLCMALMFLGAFFWSLKSGQYEDTYTPSMRVLFDDELEDEPSNLEKSNGKQVQS